MKEGNEIKYDFYTEGILRTPFFPESFLKHIDDIDYLMSIDSLREAILIASPSLYDDLYVKNKRTERVILSFVKFFIRACTRPTPFGLFAGCGIISLNEKGTPWIEIEQESEYKTYSRIDMDYLCDLIRIVEQNSSIRNKMRYHVNTTLYHIHNQLRYIEYNINNSKRSYSFSEAKLSDYLDMIIQKATLHPCTIEELASEIISDDISFIEAKEFIDELIDNQILISELEPSATGRDLLTQLRDKLNELGLRNQLIDKIIILLNRFDSMTIGTRYEVYKDINGLLSDLFPIPKKNYLHVDCFIPSKSSINNQICEDVRKGLYVLSHLTSVNENSHISSFKEAFYKRYENQEVPLVVALDPQVGVGFGNWQELRGDVNPLIDDLVLQTTIINQNTTLHLDAVSQFLINKYEEHIKNNTNSITITNDDLKLLHNKKVLDKLPAQLYTMIKVIDMNGDDSKQTILVNSFAGPSAINLLARFGYLDKKINDFIKEVSNDETKFYEGKILAEISHLPEDRLGNIQMHPHYREFEISYLSNPYTLDSNIKSLLVNDIMISVPNGQKIVLRSKKYDKEIVPRLSTAHNFSNGLPIYYFLCAIQHHNSHGLHFDWGQYFDTKPFLPRVTFENIILSPAKWRIYQVDLPKKNNSSFDVYYANLIEWKNSKGIPNLVEIVEYDNKLLIDFSKKNMVKIFINHLEKKKFCILEEFLFIDTKHPFVKRGDNRFTHELILCLHKT